jgi:hypothetical protein
MAQSQNTVREILVGNALASETTLSTFTASASPGELGVFAADGSTAGYGKDFVIALKTPQSVFKSDIVKFGKVLKYKGLDHAARVLRQITLSSIGVPATAGLKAEYMVDIRLYNFGSLSVEDYKIFHGHFVLTQTSGPLNAQTVVDGLIDNLNKNLSKEPGATTTTNPLFTFVRTGSAGSSALVITAKDQEVELGKKEGRPLEFDVSLKIKTADGDPALTHVNTVTAAGKPGVGTGRQVALMEYFYRGNRGDSLRGVGYPYDWTKATKTFANPAGAYDLVEIKHYVSGDGLNALIMPKELTVAALESADIKDDIIEAIEVFIKPSLDSLLDVNTAGATDGDVLTFDSGVWEPDGA